MQVFSFLRVYLVEVIVFLVIDMVWLGVVARSFYAKYLGYLMAGQVNWIAAFSFYLLNCVGLLIFVITPAIKSGSVSKAILYGALYGLFTYATYDLTNLATIKDWPLVVSVVDMIWGMVLSATVAGVTVYLVRQVFNWTV